MRSPISAKSSLRNRKSVAFAQSLLIKRAEKRCFCALCFSGICTQVRSNATSFVYCSAQALWGGMRPSTGSRLDSICKSPGYILESSWSDISGYLDGGGATRAETEKVAPPPDHRISSVSG